MSAKKSFTEQKEPCIAAENARSELLEELKKIKERVKYDKDTGKFTWIKNLSRFAKAGQESCSLHNNGKGKPYKRIKVCGKPWLAHRLAWFMSYGSMPTGQIDHINGDGLDNRICNLRDVDQMQNNKNLRRAKNNKSGVTGVHHILNVNDGSYGKYKATGSIGNKTVNIGIFGTFECAVKARKEWEVMNGYSADHGLDKTY